MGIVGQQFQAGDYSLPELMIAGEMLDGIERVAEPLVRSGPGGGPKKLGKVLIGAVRGDRQDVGKNVVSFLLDVDGFEVKDIGVEAPP
jgi:5-methyltetrahydrofolate--homocysteine methyltransferase